MSQTKSILQLRFDIYLGLISDYTTPRVKTSATPLLKMLLDEHCGVNARIRSMTFWKLLALVISSIHSNFLRLTAQARQASLSVLGLVDGAVYADPYSTDPR